MTLYTSWEIKTGTLILIGIALSLIGLWQIAYSNENGDVNAMTMYFAVFGIFAIGLGIVNGYYLKFLERKTINLNYLIGFGVLPVGLLFGFLISGIFRLIIIGEFGFFGIGITNLIWIIGKILAKKVSL